MGLKDSFAYPSDFIAKDRESKKIKKLTSIGNRDTRQTNFYGDVTEVKLRTLVQSLFVICRSRYSGGGMGIQNRFSIFTLFILFVFSIFSKISVASIYLPSNIYDSLTAEQKKMIHEGKQITIFEEVPDEIWPKSRVYQQVKAAPDEAMAVISDYRLQDTYAHRVAGSIPHDTADPAVKIIDYQMGLPSFVQGYFAPYYQMRNKIVFLGTGSGYRMEWELVKADSIRRIEGGARIEPLPGGEASLVYYENFISPKENTFILRSWPVLAAVKRGGGKVLQSMINHVESEKQKNSALFQQELATFRSIFK